MIILNPIGDVSIYFSSNWWSWILVSPFCPGLPARANLLNQPQRVAAARFASEHWD